MSPQDEYERLLQEPNDGDESMYSEGSATEEDADDDMQPPCSPGWLIIALVIFFIMDMGTVVYWLHVQDSVCSGVETSDVGHANSYIGGPDGLYKSGIVNSSTINPVLVVPRVCAQVYPNQADMRSAYGERDILDPAISTTSPGERHLHVSPEVGTVVQFRTVNSGMESCKLSITLPALEQPLSDQNDSFHFFTTSHIDVFMLRSAHALDARKLSFSTLPPMGTPVASFVPETGSDVVIFDFPCRRATLHTFYLSCAEGSDCLLDVWSTQNTTWGVNMWQYQTI